MKKALSILSSIVLLLSMIPVMALADEKSNLLLNASFEEIDDETGDWDDVSAPHWNVWKPTGNPLVTISEEASRTGEYGVKIAAVEQGRASVSQDIEVQGGKTYQFRSWVKTEEIVSSQGARMRVTLFEGSQQLDLLYSTRYTGTNDWTEIVMDVKVPENADMVRAQLFFEVGTGTAMFDDLSFELINPAESLSIEESEVILKEQESIKLTAAVEPEDTTSIISWTSTDERIASVDDDGRVTANRQGEAIITAATDNGLSAKVKVIVEKNADAEKPDIEILELEQTTMELEEQEVRILKVNTEPEHADTSTLVWKSSNESIATVENGIVEAISAGTATITVETEDGSVKSDSELIVKEVVLDEYDQLRKRWENHITNLDEYDPNSEQMTAVIDANTKNADKLWKSMVKNPNRTFLWPDITSTTSSADIRSNYRNVTTMTKAVTNKYSPLYRNPELLNDIFDALEWLYDNQYNENIPQYDNWWNWEIGVPNELNNIMVLLYDYMDKETIHRYLQVIDHFQPDPTKSGATTPDRYREAFGANRIDVSKVVGVRGVLVKDAEKIVAARDALSQTFENVTKENGFYDDGSFVQHENIAYNGSYGIVLIEGLTELLQLLSDSTWDVVDPKVENVYEWIENAYEPFMYKGALMDMVRGRAISRSALQDHKAGHSIIKTVVRMAQFAPEPYATKYKQMAKYWILEDNYLDYFENTNNFKDYVLAKDLLANDAISARGDIEFHKVFANMDRVVHRQQGYAFGISMYSNRIQNYEDMNNENRKGWYTGDGMTYLYNGDLAQFSDDFWPTVDPYRMPGTTVDTMKRADGSGENVSEESWVGGSALDNRYGSTGMSYKQWNSSLTAKKSWFTFENEIIALGAGISSDEDRDVETIVENRKINNDLSNQLIIDGVAHESTDGSEQRYDAIWAYLEGNVDGADIGYYFPEGTPLTVKKEQRTGAWSEINYGEPSEQIQRSYATMFFNHGAQPNNDTYSYVLLPGKNQQQTADYATRPNVEILRNDASVQAVKAVNEQIIGANFWQDEQQTVDKLTVKQKASITMQEKDGILTVAVADPTMENEGVIEVVIDEDISEVMETDAEITVEQLDQQVKLIVDVSEASGQSFTAKLKVKADESLEEDDDSEKEEIEEPSEKPEDTETPNEDSEDIETPVENPENGNGPTNGEGGDKEDKPGVNGNKGETSGSNNHDKEPESGKNNLPNTATNTGNLVLVGSVFIMISGALLLFRKRRKTN